MNKFIPAVAAALLCITTLGQPAHAAPRNNKSEIRLTRQEHRLIKAVNAYRRRQRLPELTVDPTLMREARRSAPYFNHVIGGKWCWHRCHQAGFKGWASDNIADGYPTPEEAVEGWATSHGHAMQMRGRFKMNGEWRDYRFNRIGVGISGRKYIAVFGRDNTTQAGYKPSEEPEAYPMQSTRKSES